MERAFTNVLSADVETAARFYETVLGMTRHYDSDWFVLFTDPDRPGFEFGVLDRNHETVPEVCRAAPAGVVLTFVVGDLQPVAARARESGAVIVQEPTLMPYGQTRMLLRDPDGTIVDVSSPT